MAEAIYNDQSPEVIAKEITLAVINKRSPIGGPSTESIGAEQGKLFKIILKHVREAVQKEKYD